MKATNSAEVRKVNELEKQMMGFIWYLKKNAWPIFLCGLLGLAYGVYLNLSKNAYTSGTHFYNYEISANLLDSNKYDVDAPRNDLYRLNESLHRYLKNNLASKLTEMAETYFPGNQGRLNLLVVEKVPPILAKISFQKAVDKETLDLKVKQEILGLLKEHNWKITEQNEAMFKQIADTRQKMKNIEFENDRVFRKLRADVSAADLEKYDSITSRIEKSLLGDRQSGAVRDFADASFLAKIDDAERETNYTAFSLAVLEMNELDRTLNELVQASLNQKRENLLGNDFESQHIEISTLDVSRKALTDRCVIVLSTMFGGLLLGILVVPVFIQFKFLFRLTRQALKSMSRI